MLSQHGFSENGGVQMFDVTRWNGLSRIEKQHLAECSILPLVIIFDRSYSSLQETVFVYQEFLFILNHAINSLSVKDNRKLKTGGE